MQTGRYHRIFHLQKGVNAIADKAEEVCRRFFATPETEVRHQEVFWD